MIRHQVGLVSAVQSRWGSVSELRVIVEGDECDALNYELLTGPVSPGDLLLLNTTALFLSLGSGGYHFVEFNFSRPPPRFHGRGHIMKLCYTPWQIRVLSCEEREAGYRPQLARFDGLRGTPVLIGELHSMVAPAVAVLKHYRPSCRIAYIMTDGTALPLAFSRTIAELKKKGLLNGTVTCGHAFGGDFEAVNLYSALAACRELIGAEIIILSPGPGSIGTGSRLGFSGMETGDHVNRVNALGGVPVFIPRLSFAERRRRHFGVSHHTLTALGLAAISPALLVLPLMPPPRLRLCLSQLAGRGLLSRHRLQMRPAPPLEEIMEQMALSALKSMGRRYQDDPCFFNAAAAAAAAALEILDRKEGRGKNGEAREKTLGEAAFVKLSLPGEDHQCAPGPGSYPQWQKGGFSGSRRASRCRGYPGVGSTAARSFGEAVPPCHRRSFTGGPRGEARTGGGAASLCPKRARRRDRLPGRKLERADLVLQFPGVLR